MSPLPEYGRRTKRPPAEFDHVRDIEFMEGPIISEFRADRRIPYIFIWRDSDDEFNRWLAVPTTEREITMYEARMVTLAWLVTRPVSSFLADADHDGKFKRWYSVLREEMPDEYMPQAESYFDPALRPPGEASNAQILIDGHWGLDEIARVPRHFEEAYAAQCLLSDQASARVRSDRPFSYKFKSGFVYHHFWQALNRWVFGDNDRDYLVQYASPGIIRFEAEENVADTVVRTVRELEHNWYELHAQYTSIHAWVVAKKSDSVPTEQRRRKRVATDVNDSNVRNALRAFCGELGSISYESLEQLTRDDALNIAEVVLSYYRKLAMLARYEMQSKATLVTLDPTILEPVRNADAAGGDEDK
jgi:hypothetical protein